MATKLRKNNFKFSLQNFLYIKTKEYDREI